MCEKSVGWRTDAGDTGAGTLASRKGALAGLGAREALYIEDMAGRGDLCWTGVVVEDGIGNWTGVARGRPKGRGDGECELVKTELLFKL